jgi:hypothetical protein
MNPKRLIVASLLALTSLQLTGQDKQYGFLNVIHAVPEGGICQISIDGQKINDDGFKPGQFSGGLLLAVGTRDILIEFEDKEPARGKIEIANGVTSSYAIFNHTELDKKTREPGHRVRIIRLQPASSKTYHLEAVSLSEQIQRIQISNKPVQLNFLKSVPIPGWNGGSFAVSHNAEQLGVLAAEERGAYVILVGKNSEDKVGAFFFRHFEYELPAWFRETQP